MECYNSARYFEDFEVGEVITTSARTITEADIVNFAGISSDFNPLHMNAEYAKNDAHGERIAHGSLVFSISAGLANLTGIFDDSAIAFLGVTMDYTKATKIGDTIYVKMTVKEKRLTSKGDKGVVHFAATTLNQKGETVIDGTWKLLIKAKPQG